MAFYGRILPVGRAFRMAERKLEPPANAELKRLSGEPFAHDFDVLGKTRPRTVLALREQASEFMQSNILDGR